MYTDIKHGDRASKVFEKMQKMFNNKQANLQNLLGNINMQDINSTNIKDLISRTEQAQEMIGKSEFTIEEMRNIRNEMVKNAEVLKGKPQLSDLRGKNRTEVESVKKNIETEREAMKKERESLEHDLADAEKTGKDTTKLREKHTTMIKEHSVIEGHFSDLGKNIESVLRGEHPKIKIPPEHL
jgi:hypothetical protein